MGSPLSRRFFLAAATAASSARVMGANDRIRIGLMGAGGRGSYVTRTAHEHGGAAIVAVADIYPPRFASFQKALTGSDEATGLAVHRDFRELLDRNDVDGVVIGAPDHWHVPMTIAAVQAGKDVYVEKPLTHNIAEGQRIIDAVAASNRIVQIGYQQRSYPHMQQARDFIRDGGIGRVTQVLTWWNQNYTGRDLPEIDPSQLDWQQFLGSACPRPFHPHRYRNWRWFWDYGGGTLTDLYSHWIETVHWILEDTVPVEVRGQGANLEVDWFETPDTVSVGSLYPKGFQVNYVSTMVTRVEDGGILFRGLEGSLRLTRPYYEVYPEGGQYDRYTRIPEPSIRVNAEREGTIDHVLNWLECMRSRKAPNTNVRECVEAANAAHYGNEAIRSGRVVEPARQPAAWRDLFDGRSLQGWVQDTPNIWTVRDGMIVGKHEGLKWNDFLRTSESFEDFELELEFRLVNGQGNSGIQFRSIPDRQQEHEMYGYQADIGQNYWGSLYDESRRRKVLVQAPQPAIDKLDKAGWHKYAVRAHGRSIALTIDGMRTVNYVEQEPGILTRGLVALQVHSGPGIEVHFRNIRLREL
jgi:predicted dehydrogenase